MFQKYRYLTPLFDRPGFNQLTVDLSNDIDSVFVKDFSRLGRHNAKVLLLLDEFQERGKHLIVIDDNYDSFAPDDDVIGIKTWYNEKYVKDTSKKIKRVLGARQKEGTLLSQVPFGYIRNIKNKEVIEAVPWEADYVKLIYELYIQGSGYRKIAVYLTENHVPTPSAIHHEWALAEGKHSKRQISSEWADGMIKDILDNDFYIGTYRLHKRARATVHGSSKRVPKDEQYIFENHHPAIIDQMTFELVQDMKSKRVKSNYRGSHGQWLGTKIPNPFGSCLFCKECGSRLTPIIRKTTVSERKYYICSTYNTKGKRHCSKAHLIEENILLEDVVNYIRLCRNALCERIAAYDLQDFKAEKKSAEKKHLEIVGAIAAQKKQLKFLFSQKIKDLAANTEHMDLITESYENLQADIMAHIHSFELQLQALKESSLKTPEIKQKLNTALEVVDEIIKSKALDRRDIEILIERIEVAENGLTDIELKYGLSGLLQYSPAVRLNLRENEIILITMKLISEEIRDFTSAKYLAAKLTEAGFKKTNKSIVPYIALMMEIGLLEASGNSLKPYHIVKTKEAIKKLTATFQESVPSDLCCTSIYDRDLH